MYADRRKVNVQRSTSVCFEEFEQAMDPEVFRALAEPTRMTIIGQLAAKGSPFTVSEIATWVQADRSCVSRDLAKLKAVGLVHSFRRHRHVYYEVDNGRLVDLLQEMISVIKQCSRSNETVQASRASKKKPKR